jgi:cytochrome c oxidase cbb3-type subunit III
LKLRVIKMIPFRRASWRCEQVVGRLLFISAFWAVSFCWSSGEQSFIYAQKTNQSVNSGPSHGTNSELGRILFESNCAGCHGLDGRGGEKGPNIATWPEISGRSDDEILTILQRGVPGAGMPAFSRLGDKKLEAVVRHLRTLQGLNGKTEIAGNVGEGKKLFFKKEGCATCHMINGAGGFLGSDLSSYGAVTSVAEMREQIMNHDQSPRARTMVVSTRDGSRLSGFARNEDNFSLQLQTLDGKFHFLDKSTVVNVDYSPAASAMDGEEKLTKSDLDALMSFLVITGRNSQDAGKVKALPRHHEEDEN